MKKGRRPKAVVSYNMSKIRSEGTALEKTMSSALWEAGLRGYRKNVKNIIGKPDFAWRKHRLAVFL